MLQPIRRFTPAEAAETLPLVKRIVSDILELGDSLQELYEESPNSEKIRNIEEEIKELMDELSSLGCEYKDLSFTQGLVDFPSIIDGQNVYLCWKSDEPTLLYYHGIYEGFAGRKLIPENLLEKNNV